MLAERPLASNGCTSCSMEEMVALPQVDLVVCATVGDVALRPTIAGIEAGKQIVMVNKESIVMAGPTLMDLARTHGVELMPCGQRAQRYLAVHSRGRQDGLQAHHYCVRGSLP